MGECFSWTGSAKCWILSLWPVFRKLKWWSYAVCPKEGTLFFSPVRFTTPQICAFLFHVLKLFIFSFFQLLNILAVAFAGLRQSLSYPHFWPSGTLICISRLLNEKIISGVSQVYLLCAVNFNLSGLNHFSFVKFLQCFCHTSVCCAHLLTCLPLPETLGPQAKEHS